MKGKNYSMCNRGKRKKSDFYETPYSMTEQLIKYEYFDRNNFCLEPACGNGAIVKVLNRYFYTPIIRNDINLPPSFTDFLNTYYRTFDYIITNPPYSLAYEFILKAKEITKLKFAFLMPLSYLHGQKRYENIWTDKEYPLKCIYVFTRYPLLGKPLREDGKYKTGMQVYAWYIWELGYTGEPTIKWIDNNKYVLNKND